MNTQSTNRCRRHGRHHRHLARTASQIAKAWQDNELLQPPEYEHGVPDLPDMVCVSEAEFAASVIDFCNLFGMRGTEPLIHTVRQELATLRARGMTPYAIASGLLNNQLAHRRR